MPKPANYTEMFSKAEAAYDGAVKARPNNPDYNYNFGVLYYEAAAELSRRVGGPR